MEKIKDPKARCEVGCWEEVIDFTEIEKDGVDLEELLQWLLF